MPRYLTLSHTPQDGPVKLKQLFGFMHQFRDNDVSIRVCFTLSEDTEESSPEQHTIDVRICQASSEGSFGTKWRLTGDIPKSSLDAHPWLVEYTSHGRSPGSFEAVYDFLKGSAVLLFD